jgi:hypothetical protein
MQLSGHCCKSDGEVTVLQTAARRIETNALRYACNWPAWHFVVWRLLLCFIPKMKVVCSSKMSEYICQTTWRHMREDTVIFCAFGISNFVTCSFNFCAEEILTSAQYPSSGTSHSWLSTIAYWIYVQPFSFFGDRAINPQPADQMFWQGVCAVDEDGRMILKWIVKKWCWRKWAGFIELKVWLVEANTNLAMNLWVSLNAGNSWITHRPSASQAFACSLEL